MEIWKPVKNYEGLYEVSSMGRVRDLKKENSILKLKKRIIDSNYSVKLFRGLDFESIVIGRLVAQAFLNYQLKDKAKFVDNIDYNFLNNTVENLQIISKKQRVDKQRYNEQRKDGVRHVKQINKWTSIFSHNCESIYLGLFDTEKQALEAIESKFKKKHVLIKKGVYFHPFSSKYRAIQSIDGNSKLLGSFDTAIEAYKFYLMNKNF
jgi:hypothetical protein